MPKKREKSKPKRRNHNATASTDGESAINSTVQGEILVREREQQPIIPTSGRPLLPPSTAIGTIDYPVSTQLMPIPGGFLRPAIVESVIWREANQEKGVLEAGHIYNIKQLSHGMKHMVSEADIRQYFLYYIPVSGE